MLLDVPELFVHLMVQYFCEKRDVGVIIHELLKSFEDKFRLLDTNLLESVALVQESEHVRRHSVLGSAKLHL